MSDDTKIGMTHVDFARWLAWMAKECANWSGEVLCYHPDQLLAPMPGDQVLRFLEAAEARLAHVTQETGITSSQFTREVEGKGWQPIETAPLWRRSDEGNRAYLVAGFDDGSIWCVCPQASGGWRGMDELGLTRDSELEKREPTKWQPLPEGPTP